MWLFNYKILTKYCKCCKKVTIDLKEFLSETEKRILKDISKGKSYNTIADELKISKDEVQKIILEIYQKLQYHNQNKIRN